ncbi:MAG TPA: NAD-dependent epimerase/dehydratase family protein, partial [Roseiarcus sp.]|nr:NAD-dependent epimerase/dehydratase family protein [Roseiarcus sp.]
MRVFFFGFGYCAEALTRQTPAIEPAGTARSPEKVDALRAAGIDAHVFDGSRANPGIEAALWCADAVVVSIPPDPQGPLEAFAPAIGAAPNLARIIYLSTVGVYGDHGGGWIDETAETRTGEARSLARLAEEARWAEAGRARGTAADILRLPGIYGAGRNALERLRRGEARRIVKVGHVANRVHVDDIVEVMKLVLARGLEGQIWNVADDEPAPPQDVIAYAAGLVGLPPPPEEPFETAGLTPMAASFYAETKRVSNAKAKTRLGFAPAYPTYREGLKALWKAGEGRDASAPPTNAGRIARR